MKHKVGDKVEIKSKDALRSRSGVVRHVGISMERLAGKIVTIRAIIRNSFYRIEGSLLCYDDSMIVNEYDDLKKGKITWRKFFKK